MLRSITEIVMAIRLSRCGRISTKTELGSCWCHQTVVQRLIFGNVNVKVLQKFGFIEVHEWQLWHRTILHQYAMHIAV